MMQTIFLDIKQNSDMEFPIISVYVSLWVVDGDEFLETQSTWIWIIHYLQDFSCVSLSDSWRFSPCNTKHIDIKSPQY